MRRMRDLADSRAAASALIAQRQKKNQSGNLRSRAARASPEALTMMKGRRWERGTRQQTYEKWRAHSRINRSTKAACSKSSRVWNLFLFSGARLCLSICAIRSQRHSSQCSLTLTRCAIVSHQICTCASQHRVLKRKNRRLDCGVHRLNSIDFSPLSRPHSPCIRAAMESQLQQHKPERE